MSECVRLLAGTVILRPYVFVFLFVYLIAAAAHLGWRRTLIYLPFGYSLAWLSEFTSIHWGFPYGHYYYIPTTVDRELWVLGVPFMDSLSYVFLSYCSYSVAIFIASPVVFHRRTLSIMETRRMRRSPQALVLGALLFVLLDIIIDPVALQGERWFLGRIYGYREAGYYFGIPMSNFAGWLVVGLAMIAILQLLDRCAFLDPDKPSVFSGIPVLRCAGPLLYFSILIFNLSVTFWIGEYLLGIVGCIIVFYCSLLVGCLTAYKFRHAPADGGNPQDSIR
jgi:uncharacterized membrane protein